MDQRVGRIARIGSRHSTIRIFGFLPPASCERILHGSATVDRKWKAAFAALGTDYDHGLSHTPGRSGRPVSELHESLRSLLRQWLPAEHRESDDPLLVDAVLATKAGFLALVEENGMPLLVAGDVKGISQSLKDIHRAAADACGSDLMLDYSLVESELGRLRAWLEARETKRVAGIEDGAFLHQRRKVIGRINSFASRLPLHLRRENEALVSRARRFASSAHGAGRERLLVDPGTNLSALDKFADADSHIHRAERSARSYCVRALLILVETTPPPSS